MITNIEVTKLLQHPDNPRKNIGDVTELAESIKARGILQNLTVVPAENGMYTVIIGHRRLAAAKQAGLTEVPCAVVDMDYKTQLSTMLLENMQRSDLTVYEQAQGMQMMFDLGVPVAEIVEKTPLVKAELKSIGAKAVKNQIYSTAYERVEQCAITDWKEGTFKKPKNKEELFRDWKR